MLKEKPFAGAFGKKTCFRLAVFSISNIDFAQTLPQSCKPYNRPSFSTQPIPAFLATIAGFSCSHYKLFMQSALPIHGSFNHYKLCLQCMQPAQPFHAAMTRFSCSHCRPFMQSALPIHGHNASHYKLFMQPSQAFHAISIANSWKQCKPVHGFNIVLLLHAGTCYVARIHVQCNVSPVVRVQFHLPDYCDFMIRKSLFYLVNYLANHLANHLVNQLANHLANFVN